MSNSTFSEGGKNSNDRIMTLKSLTHYFRNKDLKRVLKPLESVYFAEYGYLFPLTGRKNYIYEL